MDGNKIVNKLKHDRMFALIKEQNGGKKRDRVVRYIVWAYGLTLKESEAIARKLRLR